MAIYRFEAKDIISRKKGQSTIACAAYRAGQVLVDEQTGKTHDYSRKQRVEHTEIIIPHDAPEWAQDRAALWNAVERSENRSDAQLAREYVLTLPRELTREQQIDLVRKYCRKHFTAHGMIVDVAIHAPHAEDGEEQPHAHIMVTMRRVEKDGFAKTKAREWNPDFKTKKGKNFVADTSPLVGLREAWADHVNQFLEAAGREERVDHRSLKTQQAEAVEQLQAAIDAGDEATIEKQAKRVIALDRAPQPKLGAAAKGMEARGIKTRRGDMLRDWRAANDNFRRGWRDVATWLQKQCSELATTSRRMVAEHRLRKALQAEEMARQYLRTLRDEERALEPLKGRARPVEHFVNIRTNDEWDRAFQVRKAAYVEREVLQRESPSGWMAKWKHSGKLTDVNRRIKECDDVLEAMNGQQLAAAQLDQAAEQKRIDTIRARIEEARAAHQRAADDVARLDPSTVKTAVEIDAVRRAAAVEKATQKDMNDARKVWTEKAKRTGTGGRNPQDVR